jgi:hypothetical protein
VCADAFNSAVAASEPLIEIARPAPTYAVTVTLESAIATDGTTATSPPSAPVFDSVVIACAPSAVIVRSAPPFSVAAVSIPAVVTSSTKFSATAAPIPTDSTPPTPPSIGRALTIEVDSDCARMMTSPEPAFTTAPERISALVRTSAIESASAPAMPTEPPPAPAVASAPSSCVDAMTASIETPTAVTVTPAGRYASLTTSARLIATATPIETPPPEPDELDAPPSETGCTALPSATAFASVSDEDFSEKRPPATTVTPETTYARETESARLIATAAATETPPPLDSALGVSSAPPVPVPPLSSEALFAKLRSPSTWSSTPVPAWPPPIGLSSSGAPAADALAVEELAETVCASNPTAPPAVVSRARYDSARWLAIVRASATPTAASAPCASPSAVVCAEAFSFASASTEPVRIRAAPEPTYALAVTFERAIATDGTIETSPPEAPVFACVVIACAPLAEIVRSAPPVSVPPFSIAAVVTSSTKLSAIEAPIPTEPAPTTPLSFGSAFTTEVELETAPIVTSPAPALTTAPVLISASVRTLTMLSAKEPAIPTSPPPAPDVPSAPKSCVEPAPVIRASIVTPWALTVEPAGR